MPRIVRTSEIRVKAHEWEMLQSIESKIWWRCRKCGVEIFNNSKKPSKYLKVAIYSLLCDEYLTQMIMES